MNLIVQQTSTVPDGTISWDADSNALAALKPGASTTVNVTVRNNNAGTSLLFWLRASWFTPSSQGFSNITVPAPAVASANGLGFYLPASAQAVVPITITIPTVPANATQYYAFVVVLNESPDWDVTHGLSLSIQFGQTATTTSTIDLSPLINMMVPLMTLMMVMSMLQPMMKSMSSGFGGEGSSVGGERSGVGGEGAEQPVVKRRVTEEY